MTQEEKAEAYDKVREKIALRFGSNVAEEIFSEFEMNEDERIRKRLLTNFSALGKEWWGGLRVKDIIFWLEKQDRVQSKQDWRPSKEQMAALDEASGIVGMFTQRGLYLVSLYNDLKKLNQ